VDTSEYPVDGAEDLARRIRDYREKRDLTQRQLADQLGVTQQSVARWEQGSPPRRYMLRIIESLLEEEFDDDHGSGLADIIGIRPPAPERVQPRDVASARNSYVQGCLKLLERGERLPNRVLLLLADELGLGGDEG
jgi:transcriptional regulator with XRE-family HTH domain